ncbi:inorganic phosphate transporter [Streptomyces sp. BE20]|uniref:inorganic phosphate transporter n=1 Tax=Streptomycetaceae TaxID=2062 RepID=UPI002E7A12C3|nr:MULTISPECIES: inorganic phosphate transporter [unclassified Streptomyces]MED7954513.1 inorganic phosphate transporter [Streptomyces sp. BE303]MEE1825310.1 inorganic phosphate transporter [Streptomyces sp. BE20]
MTGNDAVLVLVVATALGFDFTNGFHDTGNAMATSIVTEALRPRVAVALSAVLNLVGAFLSTAVAATIASGLVQSGDVTLVVVFAGLVGSILWNLATWYFGIPSSSSHALIGGVVGATMAAAGASAVKWQGLVSKVIVPATLSPFIAGTVAVVGTHLVYRLTRDVSERARDHGFRIGQIGSASMVSLAHGTNDAQKTMGIITLALIANGTLHAGATSPTWVIASCAVAIALGTYLGGWRVIRTLGKGLLEIGSPQGMAAESASAAVILSSTDFGYSLSTTHVATGSILGAGVGKKGAVVRWNTARRMAVAWLFTLPASAAVGAAAYWAAHGIGGTLGVVVIFIALLLASTAFFAASRRTPVTPENVNSAWTGSLAPTPDVNEAAS